MLKCGCFESDCYAYKQNHKKLDPRREKGIFVWYSRNGLAHLEYHPLTEKLPKHSLVKFIWQNRVEQQTPTDKAW